MTSMTPAPTSIWLSTIGREGIPQGSIRPGRAVVDSHISPLREKKGKRAKKQGIREPDNETVADDPALRESCLPPRRKKHRIICISRHTAWAPLARRQYPCLRGPALRAPHSSTIPLKRDGTVRCTDTPCYQSADPDPWEFCMHFSPSSRVSQRPSN
ncbi:hypothetical protein LZ30DRAFT_124562 [Colletotrichum cereale]|nr:hypothetical protein LZ30DRAFT_124562 [Colletotrichum cereale]